MGIKSISIGGRNDIKEVKINGGLLFKKKQEASFRHPQVGDYIDGKKLYFGVWDGSQWTSRGFPTITTSDVSTLSNYWLQTVVTAGFQLRTYRLSLYIELRAYTNTSHTVLYRWQSSTSSVVTNLEEYDVSVYLTTEFDTDNKIIGNIDTTNIFYPYVWVKDN